MYNDIIIKNGWILPIVKYALDNGYISTRTKFDLESTKQYMIISYIFKNLFVRLLNENHLSGKVVKRPGGYYYSPEDSHGRWDGNGNYTSFEHALRFFKYRVLNNPEIDKKPQMIKDVVNKYRELDATSAVEVNGFFFKYPINIHTVSYNNRIIQDIEDIKSWFKLYRDIYLIFDGLSI